MRRAILALVAILIVILACPAWAGEHHGRGRGRSYRLVVRRERLHTRDVLAIAGRYLARSQPIFVPQDAYGVPVGQQIEEVSDRKVADNISVVNVGGSGNQVTVTNTQNSQQTQSPVAVPDDPSTGYAAERILRPGVGPGPQCINTSLRAIPSENLYYEYWGKRYYAEFFRHMDPIVLENMIEQDGENIEYGHGHMSQADRDYLWREHNKWARALWRFNQGR